MPCTHCSGSMAGKRRNAKFCSDPCRTAHHTAERTKTRAAARCGRVCSWCTGPLEGRTVRAMFCSVECKRAAHSRPISVPFPFQSGTQPATESRNGNGTDVRDGNGIGSADRTGDGSDHARVAIPTCPGIRAMDSAWLPSMRSPTRSGSTRASILAARDDDAIGAFPFEHDAPAVMRIAAMIRQMQFIDRACWCVGVLKAIKRDTDRAHDAPNEHQYKAVSPIGNAWLSPPTSGTE